MKKLKKLNLSRETLRTLETPELKHLAGGLPTDLCQTIGGTCNTDCPRCNMTNC